MEFFNRTGDNLIRRKLKIISQTPTEIIADVERADSNIVEEGTPIKAEIFNGWDQTVQSANTNSINAINKSNNAITESTQAKEDSAVAKSLAQEAKTLAQNAINAVADSGTRVQINGQTLTTLAFNSDPQTQINDKVPLAGNVSISGDKIFLNTLKTSGIVNLGGRDKAIKSRALNGSDEQGNDGELYINHTNAKATYFNGLNDSTTVKIDNGNIETSNVTAKGSINATSLNLSGGFAALGSVNGFNFSDTTNVGLELGRRDGTGGTPYIDFHTDGNPATDYNSRIIALSNYINVVGGGGLKVNNVPVLTNMLSSINTGSPVGYMSLNNGLKIAYGSGRTNSWSTFPNWGTGAAFKTTPSIVVSSISGGWEAANVTNQQTSGFTPNHRYNKDCRYIAIGY